MLTRLIVGMMEHHFKNKTKQNRIKQNRTMVTYLEHWETSKGSRLIGDLKHIRVLSIIGYL